MNAFYTVVGMMMLSAGSKSVSGAEKA